MYLTSYKVVADIEIGQCLVQPHVLHQVCRLASGTGCVSWAFQRLVCIIFTKF